jgi:excisionase family DNA binding protein
VSEQQNAPYFEPFLDPVEAARLLNLHPKTLTRLSREGRIPGIKLGKCWKYRISALENWVESQLQLGRQPVPERRNV